ncbi:aldose epimerase family protein [Sphingomonas qomolangmaensis]|uniref:Aldose 1-epimerase n=1 Tax=Sphingomonas qomolangmaensis TaxID=2918765 RepID=A0ABY5LE39_9SPHN|nr:aldose epimerase family protein [Sphingomonas qomolangmaensis]UUL83999.1 galactose mutarotase [Sphingomonas qomolangmaensis]
MRISAVAATVASIALASPALAADAKRSSFGKMPDGRDVPAVTLSNGRGVSTTIIALGASIQALTMPDKQGKREDVQIGYDTIDGYLAKPEFFGATVGRVANRIAKGRFTLDGKAYSTPVNNGVNSLHGGTAGFDKVLWEVTEVKSGPTASVTLRYVSPDGDMGYPGKLTTYATYSLDEANKLTIEYRATTDKPTVVNLSNHAYWNLAGVGNPRGAMGHVVTIPAERYTPTDATSIPLGNHAPVAGTVFDFRQPRVIGDRVRDARDPQIEYGRGYDHNWVIGARVTPSEHLMARVVDPVSGRGFELWSNQPGLQFYSGNFFDGTIKGKNGQIYRMGDAIVMEPQLFPDAPNQPGFPSVRLAPGQTYRNVMSYRLFVER